ncbi:MAG: hypothetical protein CBB97_13425 [Candidatus Endolissoclinum sp. TMED37]|nr:MAG: hypothetical protein CBB97_13425 [Candidatus Endolissoclinum sp. TMED37]|tara:strand:- start:3451 stop:3855 length:405 start_codon:yes stop_codon:yes gene_type:complete
MIYIKNFYKDEEYNKLYENQNNLSHTTWQNFKNKIRFKYKFFKDVEQADYSKPVICLWFFKERSDNKINKDILISGKSVEYAPNNLILFDNNDKTIYIRDRKIYKRPVVQFDINLDDYKIILNISNDRRTKFFR